MNIFNMKKLCVIVFLSAIVESSFAHSGGTNAQGCHTKHSDGSYHCHR